jgi:hypothetical protein
VRLLGLLLLSSLAACAGGKRGGIDVGSGRVAIGVPRKEVLRDGGPPRTSEWRWPSESGEGPSILFEKAAPDRVAGWSGGIGGLERGMTASDAARIVGLPPIVVDTYPRRGGGTVEITYRGLDAGVFRVVTKTR